MLVAEVFKEKVKKIGGNMLAMMRNSMGLMVGPCLSIFGNETMLQVITQGPA